MNEQNRNEIVSEWCADVAPIAGHATSAWSRYLSEVPDEDRNICMDAITNIAKACQDGHHKRSPNRAVFIAEYMRLKNIKECRSSNYKSCSLCADTGLQFMVIAMDLNKGRQVPVPYQVAVPSGKADIVHTPCSCDRGLYVTAPTFVKANTDPSQPNRHYTKEQVERIAVVCGYTSRIEAEVYRQKCEKFHHAWLEKYPKKRVDQTIGYKGKDNKQVRGFYAKQEVESNEPF